jgi:hypothetical protein
MNLITNSIIPFVNFVVWNKNQSHCFYTLQHEHPFNHHHLSLRFIIQARGLISYATSSAGVVYTLRSAWSNICLSQKKGFLSQQQGMAVKSIRRAHNLCLKTVTHIATVSRLRTLNVFFHSIICFHCVVNYNVRYTRIMQSNTTLVGLFIK